MTLRSSNASIDIIFLVPQVPDAYIDIGAEVHFLVSPKDVTHFCALSRMKESLMYRFMSLRAIIYRKTISCSCVMADDMVQVSAVHLMI